MTRCRYFARLGAVAAALLASCATYTPIRTHFNQGVRLYEEENWAGAAREYRLALEEDPCDHRARFNLAVTLEEMGRTDLARAEYEWIIANRPGDLRASANLAAIEIEEGNKEAGYARLQALVDRYETMAMPRVALASHYVRDGRTEEALVLVRQALEIDSSDIEANFLLGRILEERSDFPGARAAYEKSLANAPNDVASLLALGRVERATGKPDLARSYYRRAAGRNRNSLEAHRALAQMAEESGSLEEAVRHLWEVRRLEKEPSSQTWSDLLRLYEALARQAQEGVGRDGQPPPTALPPVK